MRPIQHGLLWKDDRSGELVPTWTASPDIAIIKTLSIQHLPKDFKNAKVKFFSEGAFNKLYEISSPSKPEKYLMRVSLPVEPFFKTESEAATLAYIRKHTSIPVPRVLGYDSSAKNDLGFEWILLEKIEGVCLYDVWEKMSYSSKTALTVHMAGLLGELYSLQFTQIGSLYFRNAADKVNGTTGTPKTGEIGGKNVNKDIGDSFVVGRIVSPWFFRDKRVWLPGDRSPFTSTHDLMLAETQIQIERIKNFSPLPTDEYFSETDEELAPDQEDILKTCYKLKELVPVIFPIPSEHCEKAMLQHDDLSEANIIVNPVTYEIAGIIDWESVAIRPAWEASDFPYFLKGIEVRGPPPVGTPGINEDSLFWIRKDWERVLLRRIYEQEMQNPAVKFVSTSEKNVDLKQGFVERLREIEMRWRGARNWMEGLCLSE
ncbi:hypothetical protein PRK78_005264 [Emydomyces testavorans]|uniref:Aminoglycoside phosphotransferase domain-containing protein n=1 Tax=Emydomyces testavorans TaxID=2070801 RepID=A0AAF0DJ78_9EURO|nr:hypothetical protein PRK78_005264 [Emydomyces testavorans]